MNTYFSTTSNKKNLLERERGHTEGNVEDEERIGVCDVRRACPSEVRHVWLRKRERDEESLDLGYG
jgi:hypothetical protein